jgi:hypothetical protein
MIPDFFIHGDVFGFRKIVGHIVFGSLFETFGTNPNPFIVTMLLVQTVNVILLFLIVRFLTKRDFTAFFVSVIFNKFYLFYFSNIHEIMGALFCLFATYIFIRYPKKIYLSYIAYMLALFSKETTFALPFLLLSIAHIQKIDKRKTLPFFIILGAYALYQAYFFFILKSASFIESYGVTYSLSNILSRFSFYMNPYVLIFLILPPLLTRNFKSYLIFVVSLMTLFPVFFFGAREEYYYFYLPAAYLLIYVSMWLPKINWANAVAYALVFFLFGGRTVLPIIARQSFPNWQKVSIQNVVKKVESGLVSFPSRTTINLKDIVLERDAKLMIGEGTLNLFLKDSFSKSYNFVYNQSEKSIVATKN